MTYFVKALRQVINCKNGKMSFGLMSFILALILIIAMVVIEMTTGLRSEIMSLIGFVLTSIVAFLVGEKAQKEREKEIKSNDVETD